MSMLKDALTRAMTPLILHIPHGSTLIPEKDMGDYVLSKEELFRENLLLADLHTDDLYQVPGAYRQVFPVSRFVVDPERFSDDANEPMAAKGMGAVYTVTTDLSPLRPNLSADRRQSLMDLYYWPHHRALDQAAQERLDAFGQCLVIDCHSYPSRRLPYEQSDLSRPQIGIGTDAIHTPAQARDAMADAFRSVGYDIGVDTPFSGSLVPNAFYGRDTRVASIMIEVRRDLYMDEITGEKTLDFPRVRDHLTQAIEYTARTVLGPGWRA